MSKKINYILMPLLIILMAGLVHGLTCAIVAPATGATIRGSSVVWNVSSSSADNASLANCTITGTSSITGDTLAISTVLRNDSAAGGLITWANATDTSYGGIDASDWVISATCTNATSNSFTCTGSTEVTIDNTKPALSTPIPPDGSTATNDSIKFSVSCVNATTANLVVGSSDMGVMGETSDVCSINTITLPNGKNIWQVVASDGLNKTSAEYSFTIALAGGVIVGANGQVIMPQQQQAAVSQLDQPITMPKDFKGLITTIVNIPLKIIKAILDTLASVIRR